MEDRELEKRVWERVAAREAPPREEDLEALLRQAREACAQKRAGVPLLQKLLWAAGGAGTMGLLWLLTALL